MSGSPGQERIPHPESNDVCLSPRQWGVAVVAVAALFWGIPAAWERIEPLPAGPDYRVPYSLGNDYWYYARTCRQLASQDEIVLVGDSVIWGHYVASDQTLSHDLNERTDVGRTEQSDARRSSEADSGGPHSVRFALRPDSGGRRFAPSALRLPTR